jgi:hypothetical protein
LDDTGMGATYEVVDIPADMNEVKNTDHSY